MTKKILCVVMVFCFLQAGFAFGQEPGTFDKITGEMRALRATFLAGVNKESAATMLQTTAKIKELLVDLFKEVVAKDSQQETLIGSLDRDLELFRFQLANYVNESTGIAVSLKIVLDDFIKLRDARNGKK